MDWIKDYKRTDVGQYAGWRDEKDSNESAKPERVTPSLMPFLRYRQGDRWWRVGFGFLWLPAIIVLLTIEDLLHVPQGMAWISLGVLLVVYVLFVLVADRLMR